MYHYIPVGQQDECNINREGLLTLGIAVISILAESEDHQDYFESLYGESRDHQMTVVCISSLRTT